MLVKKIYAFFFPAGAYKVKKQTIASPMACQIEPLSGVNFNICSPLYTFLFFMYNTTE